MQWQGHFSLDYFSASIFHWDSIVVCILYYMYCIVEPINKAEEHINDRIDQVYKKWVLRYNYSRGKARSAINIKRRIGKNIFEKVAIFV